MLLLLLACSSPDPKDTADSGSTDTGDSGTDSGDTGDSGTDSGTDSDTDSGDSGDSGGDSGDPGPVTGSFVDDVYALHLAACVDCHPWGNSPKSAYERLMEMEHDGMKFFVPGSPEESFWYMKLTPEVPHGSRMPLQLRYATSAESEALRAWIEDGAPEAGFRAGFFGTWGALACAECHGAWGGRDEAATYDGLMGTEVSAGPLIVPGDAAASVLYQKVALESPPYGDRMPVWDPYTDDATLARIEAWILAGCVYDG